MKYIFTFLTLLISGHYISAQTSYRDSLKEYQNKYKADLYEIIKSDTAFISFYPLNKSLILNADVMILSNEMPFKLMTSSGKTKEAQKYAKLNFLVSGKEYSLYAYQLTKVREQDSTHLFIPFTDETSGESSYGGGRYIDLDVKNIKDNRILIDFNKAYNPYCAFTTGYNCPIPPRENALPIMINAGEKYLAEKFQH